MTLPFKLSTEPGIQNLGSLVAFKSATQTITKERDAAARAKEREHEKDPIYDVLYFGEDGEAYAQIEDLVLRAFPEAETDDAGDGIHGYRLGVGLPANTYVAWVKFLKKHQLLGVSLWLGLERPAHPERLIEIFRS
jgi:hypothetical protein